MMNGDQKKLPPTMGMEEQIEDLKRKLTVVSAKMLEHPPRVPRGEFSTRTGQFSDPTAATAAAREGDSYIMCDGKTIDLSWVSETKQMEGILTKSFDDPVAELEWLEKVLEAEEEELQRREEHAAREAAAKKSIGGVAPVESVECDGSAEMSSLGSPDAGFALTKNRIQNIGPRLASVGEDEYLEAPLIPHHEDDHDLLEIEGHSLSQDPNQQQYPYHLLTELGRHHHVAKKSTKIVLGVLLIVISILMWLFLSHHTSKEAYSTPSPAPSPSSPSPTTSPTTSPTSDPRSQLIQQCASKLSGGGRGHDPSVLLDQEDIESSPQEEAVKWFLSGAGVHIKAPATLEECTWETDFGKLYALIVIRESLQVDNPSWYQGLPLEQFSSVCKWARLDCNGHQNKIVALYFNNANISGTLPLEMFYGLSSSLETLWLYSNDGLGGTLPTEIGLLTSLRHLEMQHTSFSQNIPSWLGRLTGLSELFLDNAEFTGTMPPEVCKLRSAANLWSLHADCGGIDPKVICSFPSCCTKCFK